jgi:hypothetical protein
MSTQHFHYLARGGIYDVQSQMAWRGYNGVWGSYHSHLVPGFTNAFTSCGECGGYFARQAGVAAYGQEATLFGKSGEGNR